MIELNFEEEIIEDKLRRKFTLLYKDKKTQFEIEEQIEETLSCILFDKNYGQNIVAKKFQERTSKRKLNDIISFGIVNDYLNY